MAANSVLSYSCPVSKATIAGLMPLDASPNSSQHSAATTTAAGALFRTLRCSISSVWSSIRLSVVVSACCLQMAPCPELRSFAVLLVWRHSCFESACQMMPTSGTAYHCIPESGNLQTSLSCSRWCHCTASLVVASVSCLCLRPQVMPNPSMG